MQSDMTWKMKILKGKIISDKKSYLLRPGKTGQYLCFHQWLPARQIDWKMKKDSFYFWPNKTKILENQLNSYLLFSSLPDKAQFRIQIFVPCNDWRTDEWPESKKWKRRNSPEFQIWHQRTKVLNAFGRKPHSARNFSWNFETFEILSS